jgi:iron only hydrogenase large subunit-like protein
VKDANIVKHDKETGKVVIDINQKGCIKCGACIEACPHNARGFADDTEEFMNNLLNKGKKIAIIVAPAVKIAFDGYWRHVLSYLRSKGAYKIYDVSFGAEICTWAHLRYLQKNPNEKLISQPCAAIANYVQKYAKQLIPSFSIVHSPMLCTAVYMRKELGDGFEIAALSPCIAKKDEFEQTGLVKYNVTFEKMREYFDKRNIDVKNIETNSSSFSSFEFDKMQGMMGSIYSSPGGLRDNLKFHYPGINVINFEGTENVYRALEEYSDEAFEDLPDVFDVLSCEHGCNGGPAVGQKYSVFHIKRIMSNVEGYVRKREKKYSSITGSKLFKHFDRTLKLGDFTRSYSKSYVPIPEPSDKEIAASFKQLCKTTREMQTYNCHACGYKTCRDMAVAIAKGLNVPEGCLQYEVFIAHKQKENINVLLEDIRNFASHLTEITAELNISAEHINHGSTAISGESLQSVTDMAALDKEVESLQEKFKEIKQELSNINVTVEDYTKMSDAVNTIARQINILSINASVEAARAGELGKGFTVVAEEVRTLAGHSQAAVREADVCNDNINKSIVSINEILNNSNAVIGKLAEVLEDAKNTTNRTIDEANTISSYMNDMLKQSKNISDIVAETNKITEEMQLD